MTRIMPAAISGTPKKSAEDIFKKAVIVVPLSFCAVAALLGISELHRSLAPTGVPMITPAAPPAAGVHSIWTLLEVHTGVPAWISIITAAILATLLVWAVLHYFPDIRKRYFASMFASLVALAVFVLYKHDLLDESTRDIFYVLAPAAFLALWAVNDKWFAFAFAVFTFTLLGSASVGWTWYELDGKLTAIIPGGSHRSSASKIPNICDGVTKRVSFGKVPVDINPGATCVTPLWHDGHCLYFKRAAWTNDPTVYGPHCKGPAPADDIEWVWSADEPFIGAVALQPPRYR